MTRPCSLRRIGTTKVCVLIGEVGGRSGGVDVIGIGQAPSDGLRKGVVIDIDRTVQSVAAAVHAAERLSGLSVRSAFVGISGSHVGSQNSRGMIAVSSRQHEVTAETPCALSRPRACPSPTRARPPGLPRGHVGDDHSVFETRGMSASASRRGAHRHRVVLKRYEPHQMRAEGGHRDRRAGPDAARDR